MVGRFYNTTVDPTTIPTTLDGVLTPAEVMECLCTNFRNQAAAMADLERKAASARPAVAEKEVPAVSVATAVISEPEAAAAAAAAAVPTITGEEVPTPLRPKIIVEEDTVPKIDLGRQNILTKEDLKSKSIAQLLAERDAKLANTAPNGIIESLITGPDARMHALFKQFENAKTHEEFEAVHKLANTFQDLQPFEPDAA
jgi:hypothetical protein